MTTNEECARMWKEVEVANFKSFRCVPERAESLTKHNFRQCSLSPTIGIEPRTVHTRRSSSNLLYCEVIWASIHLYKHKYNRM